MGSSREGQTLQSSCLSGRIVMGTLLCDGIRCFQAMRTDVVVNMNAAGTALMRHCMWNATLQTACFVKTRTVAATTDYFLRPEMSPSAFSGWARRDTVLE